MAYNDDGVYIYETIVPAAGDMVRKAFYQLMHDVESYLFDTRHPGYARPEYLSWSLARAEAQHVSSGNPVDRQIYWDPSIAGNDDVPNEPKEGQSWGPGSVGHFGIRYPKAAFQAEGVDTDRDAEHGEAELYHRGEVTNAADASTLNIEAKMVDPRTHEVPAEADEKDED